METETITSLTTEDIREAIDEWLNDKAGAPFVSKDDIAFYDLDCDEQIPLNIIAKLFT